MTQSLGCPDESIPKPLQNLVRAVLARFPDKVDVETVPLRDTGESGVEFVPRNSRAASVFCMYDGVEDHDSFYIRGGSVLSIEFQEVEDSDVIDAGDWALDLISNIGQFGLYSILVKNLSGRTCRTDVFAPESQAEVDSVSLGEDEVLKAHYEPW